jgi:catechol 2,3-dioxygenase-like lactoylglutathione lyase family enzyme
MSHRKITLALSMAGIAACITAAGTAANAAPEGNQPPPPVTALSMMGSALPCADLDRSIAFYTNGLGMTLAARIEMPSATEAPLMFPGGGAYIMLFKPKGDGAPANTHGTLNRLILAVPDIKALEAKLNAAGYHLSAPVAEQPKYHVAVGQVEDPDGNHLELVQRLP